jgi:hypothetical protein
MDWLGSYREFTAGRRGVPRPDAALGVHVVLELRHLRGAEMADMVEGAATDAS